ncbi:glycosyltransferase involved in cell wall biosynthesis [Geothermobacter ehrlichii]|uniref:Glycosyltransferase involved in cell wall biosynthesis n=1 Tax=Geothermobacter ehrlichii TaxID=213224 RepID=A0A5D3WIS0_9BACT|nr:glycosyltransferase involved in cell wall biosynthesis [Geothermobacter ehrlichii]
MQEKEIIIVGNARSYHAIDWYRTIKNICNNKNVLLATDLIDSESYLKIVREDDRLIDLYNIDWLLFDRQTSAGNLWRNFIKFIFIPIQVVKINDIRKKYPKAIYHAHSMYYMLLCWLARIKFIGTPLGSEVLVRSDKSSVYRYFAIKSLMAASHILVDSENLKNKIYDLCGKKAIVIQNGIDVSAIKGLQTKNTKRSKVLSIRAIVPLYRIEAILEARDASKMKPSISFIYPFWADDYKRIIMSKLDPGDSDLGRLSRGQMYELLTSTALAISIPKSDSSPRSVYEAIFCGCCVAVTYNPWIENLPSCMRSRLYVVDIEDEEWLDKAYDFALSITKKPFKPSQMALDLFDQKKTMKKVVETFYEAKCDL